MGTRGAGAEMGEVRMKNSIRGGATGPAEGLSVSLEKQQGIKDAASVWSLGTRRLILMLFSEVLQGETLATEMLMCSKTRASNCSL